MKFIVNYALLTLLISSFLNAGTCTSKVIQEPRQTAWDSVKQAPKKKKITQAIAKQNTVLSEKQKNELSEVMKVMVPDLWKIVFTYLKEPKLMQVSNFPGHTKKIFAVQASNDTEFISASLDGTVKLWNGQAGQSRTLVTFEKALKNPLMIKLSGNTFITSCGDDEQVQVWDRNKREKITTFTCPYKFATLVPLTETSFASGSQIGGKIKQWNVNTGSEDKQQQETASPITCMARLDEDHLIVGSKIFKENYLRLWNITEGNPVKSFNLTDSEPISIIPLDKQYFVTISARPMENHSNKMYTHIIRLWRTDTLKPIRTFQSQDIQAPCIAALDDTWFVTGHLDGVIRIWHKDKENFEFAFPAHKSEVSCITKMNDDQFISGSTEGTLALWKYSDPIIKSLQAMLKMRAIPGKTLPATAASLALISKPS